MTGERRFVSRGGEKLQAALEAFGIDVTGRTCADFGANVGGFTHCLLDRGAERVFAVDTGYGALDWRLRNDPRVVVMERTNALYADPPSGGVALVAIDVAFTPQRRIVPAAARWVAGAGDIVSLLKPHYERAKLPGAARAGRRGGPLGLDRAEEIRDAVCRQLAELGLSPADSILSRTLFKDEHARMILFGFAQGQELSEHTASMPAILYFVKGEASLTLGEEYKTARPGTWVHMDPHLPHSIYAKTPVVMVLILIEN